MDMQTWRTMINDSNDFEGLMRRALAVADPALRDTLVTTLLDCWLSVDIPGFIRFLNALEVGRDKTSLAIVASALQDSLTRLGDDSAFSDDILVVVQRLISHLAETDPWKALEWARKSLLDYTLDSSLVSIARNMSRKDVAAALEVAESITSTLRRSQALAAIATVWAGKDPVAALAWAGSLSNPAERALATNSILLVAAETDVPGAAQILSDQAQRINQNYLQERDATLGALGVTEADLVNDPESYRDLRASGAIPAPVSPDIELMAPASKVIGTKLAEGAPSDAIAWAESLDGDYLKFTSLAGVLGGWGATDPASALAWVEANYPVNFDLYSSVYRSWAANDPSAAANAARYFPTADQRAALLENIMKVWGTAGDPNQAAAFVHSLPQSTDKDSASYALATTISYARPEQAWLIAQDISNESAQLKALKAAFSVMVVRDPAGAAQTLNSATLSGRATETLMGMLNAVGGE